MPQKESKQKREGKKDVIGAYKKSRGEIGANSQYTKYHKFHLRIALVLMSVNKVAIHQTI